MRSAIVVGHHKKSKGAFSPYFNLHEWDFYNLVAECLQNVDVYHHNHKIKGYTNRVRETSNRINQKDYDLVIELHFNSSDNPRANGCETLYYFDSLKGRSFAKAFSDLVHKRTGIKVRNNGLKALTQSRDRGFASVYYPKSPVILIEPFFGSNSKDCQLIESAENVSNIINEFLNII